jgi:hypothetical protein
VREVLKIWQPGERIAPCGASKVKSSRERVSNLPCDNLRDSAVILIKSVLSVRVQGKNAD